MTKEEINKCIPYMYRDLLDGFMKWEIQDKFIKGFYAYKPTGKKTDNTWFEKTWN